MIVDDKTLIELDQLAKLSLQKLESTCRGCSDEPNSHDFYCRDVVARHRREDFRREFRDSLTLPMLESLITELLERRGLGAK